MRLAIGWSGVVMKSMRKPLWWHLLRNVLSLWYRRLCLRILLVHLRLLMLMRRIHQMRRLLRRSLR